MDKYEKQLEKEKQQYDKKHAEDFDFTYSNDPINEASIDYEAWTEFFSYYRYYIDEFAMDILHVDLFSISKGNSQSYGQRSV